MDCVKAPEIRGVKGQDAVQGMGQGHRGKPGIVDAFARNRRRKDYPQPGIEDLRGVRQERESLAEVGDLFLRALNLPAEPIGLRRPGGDSPKLDQILARIFHTQRAGRCHFPCLAAFGGPKPAEAGAPACGRSVPGVKYPG